MLHYLPPIIVYITRSLKCIRPSNNCRRSEAQRVVSGSGCNYIQYIQQFSYHDKVASLLAEGKVA